MGVLSLGLALLLGLLQLLYCGLEFPLGILEIFLSCISLLLKEFEFSIPESLVSVVRIVQVSILSFKFVEFSSPPFHFFLDLCLVSLESLCKLLISLSQLIDLIFIVLDEIFLLLFEILIFLKKHSSLPFHL